jgi:hypothetical protein
MYDDPESHPLQDLHIPFCMSCINSSGLSNHIKPSLHQNLSPIPLPTIAVAAQEEESDVDENDSVIPEQAAKKIRIYPDTEVPTSDAMSYLSGHYTQKLLPPNYCRTSTRHNSQLGPHFAGAFYIPYHKLII